MSATRPIYENKQTLKAEQDVVRIIESKCNCKAEKLPRSYALDYALIRKGSIVALCEIKCRNVRSTDYPTIMISVMKRINANLLSTEAGFPAFLFVNYLDGIRYINFFEDPDETTIGGRADRNDPADREMVVHYKIERLLSL